MALIRPKSMLVPGHQIWRAVRSRRGKPAGVVCARHRVLRWQKITVQTRDLRYGAEAIARYLNGGKPGLPLADSRLRSRSAPYEAAESRSATGWAILD